MSGDLNGDGLLDLVATRQSLWFEVFFGRADGGLGPPVMYKGIDGESVSLIDVDGDGDLDVIASDGISGLVAFQNDGRGNLQLGATYPTTAYPEAFASGDLNGDGQVDLVLAESDLLGDHLVEVLWGLVSGGFSLPALVPGISSSPFAILVGDLNRDGRPDIVANTIDGGQLAVLLNQGDGGFERSFYPSPIYGGAALLPSASGAPDLLVSITVGGPLQLLRNSGKGTFSLGPVYPAAGGWLTVGDFNGDCILDVATSAVVPHDECPNVSAGAWVLFGDGDGGFGLPQALATKGGAPEGLSLLGSVLHPHALGLVDGCGAGVEVFGNPSQP